jgi:IPT/TIG domain
MSSVLPTTISVRGGQPVTIIGTGFREGLRVLFDGIPARAIRVDGGRFLLATTPRHAPGPVEVIVADDQSLVRLGGTVTYACPPVPDEKMFFLVLLAGALGGLVHALRSFFWYVGQRELVWSWTPMYLLLPFTGAALAFVFFLIIRAGLYTPQGEASLLLVGLAALVGMFSTQAAEKLKDIADGIFTKAQTGKDHAGAAAKTPAVTAIVPASGPVEGSTWVTVKGSGFVNGTSVQFGTVPASKVTIKDESTMRVVLPPQTTAGAVEVRVTVPRATPLVTSFTYKVPIGKVTTSAPNAGPKKGGNEVTITGEKFVQTSTVLFGDTAATKVTFVSPTELKATTPPNEPGPVDIRVDNGTDIVGVLNRGYTYEPN